MTKQQFDVFIRRNGFEDLFEFISYNEVKFKVATVAALIHPRVRPERTQSVQTDPPLVAAIYGSSSTVLAPYEPPRDNPQQQTNNPRPRTLNLRLAPFGIQPIMVAAPPPTPSWSVTNSIRNVNELQGTEPPPMNEPGGTQQRKAMPATTYWQVYYPAGYQQL
uniref:SAM domain-containing protein n=1 Tax=Strongyloides papillosus TaxID=174720 RepID=A0A0N5BUS0_STREA